MSFEICRRQVTLAGYRLANLVLSIFEGKAKVLEKGERYKSIKIVVDQQKKMQEL